LSQSSCTGKPNTKTIFTDAPKLISSAKNGRLYQTYASTPALNVLHVWGSPYDMGYSHGSLLKTQINEMFPQTMQWMADQVENLLPNLPEFLRKAIENYGIEAALFLNYEITKGYTPSYILDELRGISDGSGIDYNLIAAIHMLPEITQAACSIIGAWGDATDNKTHNGPLYQLRALDWATDGPFQQYPVTIIYHPDMGHPFSIMSWTGFIGTITGFSSVPLAISEKVWLEYKGYQNRFGYPFHFLLRDFLQFDNTTDDVVNRIEKTVRTCSIWIGVGTPPNDFKVIQYGYENFKVMDDRNFPSWSSHPSYKNVVYVDKHTQPSGDDCLGSVIGKDYGNINAINIFQKYTALSQTGDMQIAVYDFNNMYVYLSNAGIYDAKTKNVEKAYDRPFTRLDMKTLFNEKL